MLIKVILLYRIADTTVPPGGGGGGVTLLVNERKLVGIY